MARLTFVGFLLSMTRFFAMVFFQSMARFIMMVFFSPPGFYLYYSKISQIQSGFHQNI